MGSAEGAGPPATRGKDTGSLRQIGLRYAVTGALAFGFTLGGDLRLGLWPTAGRAFTTVSFENDGLDEL
jgi:hypothetical protein